MKTFSVPAGYLRFIEATIAQAVAEVGADAEHRADEDPRVRRMAKIPPGMVDSQAEGRVQIIVGVEVANEAARSDDEIRILIASRTPMEASLPAAREMTRRFKVAV